MSQVKFVLDETQIPKFWYNLTADLTGPLPPVLHPGTKQPAGPGDLEPLFPMALIMQEVSTEREIEIPEPIRDVYRMWRPSPLIRARRLEQALGTPAKSTSRTRAFRRLALTSRTRPFPGLVQQGTGHHAPFHRDRRRTVSGWHKHLPICKSFRSILSTGISLNSNLSLLIKGSINRVDSEAILFICLGSPTTKHSTSFREI